MELHEVRLHFINLFCVATVVEKCTMASPDNLLVFCTAWKQDTFPRCEQSYNYDCAQPAVQTKGFVWKSLLSLSQQSSAVSGLWM